MVSRGQIWTVLRGGSQYRALVVSNDEYNVREGVPVWALSVVRDVPRPDQLVVRLRGGDPLMGCFIRIPAVMQIGDRTAWRDNHGYVSHDTMNSVERGLRAFLELP